MMRVLGWVLATFMIAQTASAQLCIQHIVSPDYPRLARIARVEGRVTLTVNFDEKGKVASIGASSGPPLLVRPAEENIRQWVLCPRASSSGPMVISYTYALEGKPQYEDGPAKVIFELPGDVHITARPYEPQPQNSQAVPGRSGFISGG